MGRRRARSASPSGGDVPGVCRDHSSTFSPRREKPVDYTPGADVSAGEGARSVRKLFLKLSGYEELDFGRIHLNRRSAYRWRFDFKGESKVDYFLSECGTGYAFLGATPTGRFDEFRPTFTAIAESLEPTC
jgi:hypothetical protein